MTFGEPGEMQWTEYDIGSGTLALGCGAPDWQPRRRRLLSVAWKCRILTSHLESTPNNVKFKMEPIPTPVCNMAFISDPRRAILICIHKRKAK